MKSRLMQKVLVFLIAFMVLSSTSIFSFDPDPSRLPGINLPGFNSLQQIVYDMIIIAEGYTTWLHPDHENIVLTAMNTLGGFSTFSKNRLMDAVGINDYLKILNGIDEFAEAWVL